MRRHQLIATAATCVGGTDAHHGLLGQDLAHVALGEIRHKDAHAPFATSPPRGSIIDGGPGMPVQARFCTFWNFTTSNVGGSEYEG